MVRDFSQKTVQELYETIRVNVDEEEQWKVFDFVEDFFMEELEIGDYINDINSYHLHMFDKHDVTTKKFDAIVEKAGKVDANYAAQIEGYCSLLGEYGKKFEAVCAMLQPEKLRLSPDKYREKLEGINTGYQNAKDTHEQEQSAYEAELYEIETVWYKKMLDKAEDYLIRSAECVVLGNFTDEVTVLGVGVQIVLGIFDLDLPCDIRDIIADIKNLAETDRVRWDLIGMLALDLIGLIPVIGALKYSDEIGTLFKNADKVSVVARSTDGTGVLAKHADEAGAWLHGVKVFKYSDETAEAVASGEKLLKESGTIYESFADMMSPEDAAKYLDFLENGSKEGLTSAELAGVEKADALLVSQKVGYEDVWDLRNVGDVLERGRKGGLDTSIKNIDEFIGGNKSFDDVLDDYAKVYADKINSNQAWSWDDTIPGGENLTKKQRSIIKQQAIDAGLITDIKVTKVEGMRYGFADFESAGVVKETQYLPENMWKMSDAEQFKWLDEQIGGTVDGYTWHHTEIPGKMQLVPTGIHNITTHNGGRTAGMWVDAPR